MAPRGLVEVGMLAFYNSRTLRTVRLNGTAPKLGRFCFLGTAVTKEQFFPVTEALLEEFGVG